MSLAERLNKTGRLDRTAEIRTRLQQRLVESLGPRDVAWRDRPHVLEFVRGRRRTDARARAR